ncbi:hypothetical protein MOQ_004920 [Trypanosoma cruzi marinkellei]|uniref:Uncharacterized protein n=1 Tax=Trypanosoma cruzi marinkellei TaxID=85056 RepID=K2M880_TRYCR|nr:hypothetical protein MOQ_004920 [Trypanosoma cruzi marinkellei]
MRGHSAEVPLRPKNLQSSLGLSSGINTLPGITSIMRNEFLPLMQCLEQGNDVLSKTYIVELALTLSRFDALLKEEERRIFVCAFDALVRRLLKDLHHLIEVESLLHQDLLMLMELAERCRRVHHLYDCHTRSSSSGDAGGKSRGVRSTSSHSSVAGNALDVKGQRGTLDPPEACVANCTSAELQQLFQSDVGRQLHPTHSMTASGTWSAGGNENTANQPSSSTIPPQISVQPLKLLGMVLPRNFTAKRASCWTEDFWDFLEGRIPKGDITALGRLLLSQGDNKNENFTPVSNTCKDLPIHASTKSTRAGSNNRDVSASSVAPVDATLPKRMMQNAEDNDSLLREMDGSKCEEAGTAFLGGRTMNQTAFFLNMLVEGLLFGGPSSVSSLNSSFGSMEDAEQNSAVTDAVNESRCSGAVPQGDMIGRFITLPSPAALSMMSMLFPSLRNYAEDFTRLAGGLGEAVEGNSFLAASSDIPRRTQSGLQRIKGMHATTTIGGLFGDNSVDPSHPATTLQMMNDASGLVRPNDVVLYVLLRSLQRVYDQPATTTASTHLQVGGTEESTPKNFSFEYAAATTKPQLQDNATTPTLFSRIGVELENMMKQVQEYITSSQTMQEQIREEVTLLIFRVISTTFDFLLPAVQFVDLRVSILYRKWLCDMYRLLWEEDLLDRFSAIVAASLASSPNDNACGVCSSSSQPQPTTPRRGGGGSKRHLGKGDSTGGSTTPAMGETASKNTSNHPSHGKGSGIVTSNETLNKKREDKSRWIAPGNAYSRAARGLTESGSELMSLSSILPVHPSKFRSINKTPADVSLYGFGLFDDPTVLMAESLLEEKVEDIPTPHGFVMTRLMAALLRDGISDKLCHLHLAPERSLRDGGLAVAALPDSQPSTVRKTATPSARSVRQPTRKKNTSSPHRSPMGVRSAHSTPEIKSSVPQQRPSSRYPVVTNVKDVKALYYSVLCDTEVALSPLDPVRAAVVQNTVDFLVSGMRLPREAYELLDAYLDDVGIEPIQPPATRRVALDGTSEASRSGAAGGDNPLTVSDSPFSVTTVRRARQMPSDNHSGTGGKTHTSHASHTPQVKRGGLVDKETSAAALRLPLIPKVIPSWNTQEETEQFLVILALLRREYIVLRGELGLAQPAPPKESKEAFSR